MAVVGSGFSGIGTAVALRRHGIADFAVLERASNLGGTWRDNTYPGAACDVPSQLYSFSFARNPDWSRSYSPQPLTTTSAVSGPRLVSRRQTSASSSHRPARTSVSQCRCGSTP